MNVTFPANCKSEHGHLSYSIKLLKMAIDAHNAEGKGTTPEWAAKIEAVLKARNEATEIARSCAYWNPAIPGNVSNGNITYPVGLNQSNEGSRMSFLIGLSHKLILDGRGQDDEDMVAVQAALNQAKQDAINGEFWNPSLEDIS